MHTRASPCRFQPCPKSSAVRHEHPYTPPPSGQVQCRCGSRRWIVVTGGSLPTSVVCERNRDQSRLNTMYERGRDAGPGEEPRATGTAPF